MRARSCSSGRFLRLGRWLHDDVVFVVPVVVLGAKVVVPYRWPVFGKLSTHFLQDAVHDLICQLFFSRSSAQMLSGHEIQGTTKRNPISQGIIACTSMLTKNHGWATPSVEHTGSSASTGLW